MKRKTFYPAQVLDDAVLLQMQKDIMMAIGKFGEAVFNSSYTPFPAIVGLAATPGAGLTVNIAPGQIYDVDLVDDIAYGSLAVDNHSVLKQGFFIDPITLSCPAPTTAGKSIRYLVQVRFVDVDVDPIALTYYNSANPSQPFVGVNNSGASQYTAREGQCEVTIKAGVMANTGSQVAPAVDAGRRGLYTVDVAYGQSSVVVGNIAAYPGTNKFVGFLPADAQAADSMKLGGLNQAQLIASILSSAHPVGSYYFSDTLIDPGVLFGGTWVRVKDKFILAAGDIFAPGTTGGEAQHTLTIGELPSHSHDIANLGTSLNVQVGPTSGSTHVPDMNTTTVTSLTGSNQAHNNMPPYQTAYCWKRTA